MAREPCNYSASAYNARVDRLDAIRLLQALVAAGANSRTPMASAWVDKIAVREMSLHGTALASAIAYAEAEGWLADIPTRKDCISLTRAGEVIAKLPKLLLLTVPNCQFLHSGPKLAWQFMRRLKFGS